MDAKVQAAYQAVKALTDEQRADIFCRFCAGCYRYLGPGDYCQCQNDD